MKFTFDNFDGQGAVEYTDSIDRTVAPSIERRLNQPSRMQCHLIGEGLAVPISGSRMRVVKAGGKALFTGYVTQAPVREFLGCGEKGPVYRYKVLAESDEVLLDQKVLPDRAPFVGRSAGSALRQLVSDLLPGALDVTGVHSIR